MDRSEKIFRVLAITCVVASIVVSCKSKLAEADSLILGETPIQVVENMFAVQSKNGKLSSRIEAGVMESYDNDSIKYELFPKGLSVFSYTEDGDLESLIFSDNARHVSYKDRSHDEKWEAFGNVVIHNVINNETMETDTIYWDQTTNEIYTDCYVKMYSRDGFMQGYGMRSDDHARNSILHRPFNSYGYTSQDSTLVVIDSVNFIGPLLKN